MPFTAPVVVCTGAVTSLAGMKEILKDEPPSSLSRINRKKLEAMGLGKTQIDALLKNYNYSPMDMTLMVEALKRMGDIKGRDLFVTYATAAPDRVIARYMQQYAEMLANYITGNERGDIMTIDDEVWLMTRSGKLVGAFPLDYLGWTAEVDGAERAASEGAQKKGVKGKALLIEGQVSPEARKAFEARGWSVKENVQLAAKVSGEARGKPGVSPAGVGAGVLR